MSDRFNSHSHNRGGATVGRVVASPALRDIVAWAGLNVADLYAGSLRIWRAFNEDGKPRARIDFAALTVDQLASRVRFHVLYDNDDEVRMTFSLQGCLVNLESGDVGLEASRPMQSVIEEVLKDFRWAVHNLPSVH
jgi:hypothetical protein